jgi:hypothetical protein
MPFDKKLPFFSVKPGELPPDWATPFVKGSQGLWLPADVTADEEPADERPAALQFSIRTVGWEAITGQQATLQQVVDRVTQLSLAQTIGLVGRITIALHDVSGKTVASHHDRQLQIAEGLLGSDGARKLVEKVKEIQGSEYNPERFALFHERQVLNLLKLAFLALDVAAPETANPNLIAFTEALLLLNDLIDPPEGSMGPQTPGGMEAMDLYISANILFNESPHILRELVRAHHMYIESRPEVTIPGGVDVPALMQRATGMEAETVWRALFAIYANWAGRTRSDVDAGRIAASKSSYLSTLTELTGSERDGWFELATWEHSELQDRIRRDFSLAEPRFWDVLPFEQKPLVAVGDLIYCCSIPLFRRLAAGSLQHRLQDRDVFTESESRRFRDTRGYIVENYTLATLARTFGERLIPEKDLQRYSNGRSVCDAIVVYPDALLLIECKTASPLLDTRHATNYAAYRAQWGQRMQKAASQFESTIQLLREGAFASVGLSATSALELFPVVGVFEQPVHPLMYRAIRNIDLANHPLSEWMDAGEVRPLQLLHIREVEMWESAAEHGRSILDILRDKTSGIQSTELSFHHFIHSQGETFQNEHSKWQASRFAEISNAARAYYRSLGLSADSDEDWVVEDFS